MSLLQIKIKNPTTVSCPEDKIVFNLVPSETVKQEEEENEGNPDLLVLFA